MYNIMLDPKPTSWHGFPINTDFRVGVQIHQLINDASIDERERAIELQELLFPGVIPCEENDIIEAVQWYVNGWNTDREPEKKDNVRVIDFDVDQWRLYSAFLAQYHIDLHIADLHWWEFMGLLVNLEECSFTRICAIRRKKIHSKMGKEEKEALKEAKKIYSLDEIEIKTEKEKQVEQEAIEAFERMRRGQK